MNPPLQMAITRALDRCGERVRPAGPRCWSFELANGRRLTASASWETEWLTLQAPLGAEADPDLLWTLLTGNAGLGGPARLVRPQGQGPQIRADVVVADPDLIPLRITTACESVKAAAAVHAGKTAERRVPSAEPPDLWEQLAEEPGWSLTRHEDHRLGVELDAPGLMNQAFLERRNEEPVAAIELLRAGDLSPQSRRAVARFLLALTARMAVVRACVREIDGMPAVRLESPLWLQPPATGGELALALEALSLACRLGMREVRALAHEPLAGTYLAHTTKE